MVSRALVLGGGGPVGIAWETGLLAGLADEGVRLDDADFIVGTSAGSVVGAQLAFGRTPADLYAALLRSAGRPQEGRPTSAVTAAPAPNLTPLMDLMRELSEAGDDRTNVMKKIGRFALDSSTIAEDAFIAGFGALIAQSESWPARPYACTAVNAESGEFVLWNRDSEAPLSKAVASSCSVPGVYPPVTINGNRYIDGGMRSSTNADVATGYERVVGIAVSTAIAGPLADAGRQRLESELATLRDSGADVTLIEPDADSKTTFGPNLMDFTRRTASAEQGFRQGSQLAGSLSSSW